MRDTAAGLAALGRGPDSMLVHMSPGEVASLQKIAMAHGGSLTINPQTGLPEAGILRSILPIVAGAGLTALTGNPMLAAAIVGGVGAAATGSLGQGLMMGLGAYGGANIGSALGAAGAAGTGAAEAATVTNAATVTSDAANAALQQASAPTWTSGFDVPSQDLMAASATPGGTTAENFYWDPAKRMNVAVPYTAPTVTPAPQDLIASRAAEQAVDAAMPAGTPTLRQPTTMGGMGTGISNLMSSDAAVSGPARNMFMKEIGGGSGLAKYGLMAAAPMLQEAMQPKPLDVGPKQPTQYYKTSFSQERNPRFGQPGEPYFIQRYAPGSYTTNPINAAGGGLMALADGGYVPESGKFRIPTLGAEGDESRMPRTSIEFGGYAPERDDPLKSMSEMQLKAIAARSKDPELKGRAINELYVRQSTATPAQGFMSAEDYSKGAARGGLMALAEGGAVPPPSLPAQAPATSPLFQQVQTQAPDALSNYLAGLGQSLMGAQPQPQSPGPGFLGSDFDFSKVVDTSQGWRLGGSGLSGQIPSTQKYTFNPATQQFGLNPSYVDPASLDTGAPDRFDQNSRYSGDGDAAGGPIKAKYAAGGLGSLPEYAAGGKLLDGPGDGVSDSIPAVIKGPKPQRAALADGEFVIPARIVSELGNGSTKAGSDLLDKFREEIRSHKRSAPVDKIPPPSKSPLQYLKQAQSRSKKNG